MPKGRRKVKKGADSMPPSEEEYDTADNMSTVSATSEESCAHADDPTQENEIDETAAIEQWEDKIKEYIEGLTMKSAQARKTALQGLTKALSKKYMIDFLADRKVTISDAVCRCLKKGKGDEQALAAQCISLLIVQLGQDSEEIINDLHPVIQTIMLDNSASLKARAECATCLSVISFIGSDDIEHSCEVMNVLQDVFKNSFKNGANTIPTHSPDMYKLHANALSGWALLLSIAPPNLVEKLVNSYLKKMLDLLLSQDVDLRITAGETIALMYELAREEDEEFEGDNMTQLCEILKQLATDSNKYRAKKDRRQQRSSFRDILHTVEDYETPENSISFGTELIYIDSWTRKKQYDTLCQVLTSGINQHLRDNEMVREIFGIGPPIPVASMKPTKGQRHERHLYNAAVFKARTKLRAKFRDKRSVAANGF